jgi:hypothetical protein
MIDDGVPVVGEHVFCAGFGEMAIIDHNYSTNSGRLSQRLVVRVGRVLAVHLDGYHMLKNPCVEMTVPVFSGMSGGLVARVDGPQQQIRPFALISYASEPQPNHDTSTPGRTIGSMIRAKVTRRSAERQELEIPVTNMEIPVTNIMRGRKSR